MASMTPSQRYDRFGPIKPMDQPRFKLRRIFWCAVASWVVVGVAARLLGWW
jgi:hypothetical protein